LLGQALTVADRGEFLKLRVVLGVERLARLLDLSGRARTRAERRQQTGEEKNALCRAGEQGFNLLDSLFTAFSSLAWRPIFVAGVARLPVV
jgi:hypothetical protein